MQPGRELDALVAEKVMGMDDLHGDSWRRHPNPPHFSTDIAAAWLVVEKLKDREPMVSWDGVGEWMCTMDNPDGDGLDAFASTAPHAICLAALNAVGAL